MPKRVEEVRFRIERVREEEKGFAFRSLPEGVFRRERSDSGFGEGGSDVSGEAGVTCHVLRGRGRRRGGVEDIVFEEVVVIEDG
jgi:hypothetical protein